MQPAALAVGCLVSRGRLLRPAGDPSHRGITTTISAVSRPRDRDFRTSYGITGRMQTRWRTGASVWTSLLLVRDRRQELEEVQEEVHEVQVDGHGELDRLRPGVLGVTEPEEVVHEVAGKNHHAEQAVHDVHRAGQPDEDADDPDDDETEETEAQIGAPAAQIRRGQQAVGTAASHDAGSAQEGTAHRLPAELLGVHLDRRTHDETGQVCPAHEQDDAHDRVEVGGDDDSDRAEHEAHHQRNHAAERLDTPTAEGTEGTHEHGAGEEQRDFREQGFHVVNLSMTG